MATPVTVLLELIHSAYYLEPSGTAEEAWNDALEHVEEGLSKISYPAQEHGRAATIEECARLVEEIGDDAYFDRDRAAADYIAKAIRALSPVPSTDSAPGHTDLMVSPESIDEFLESNPLPHTDSAETRIARGRALYNAVYESRGGKWESFGTADQELWASRADRFDELKPAPHTDRPETRKSLVAGSLPDATVEALKEARMTYADKPVYCTVDGAEWCEEKPVSSRCSWCPVTLHNRDEK
jgi:hypothetical protein